jgi:quinol monooxygenase YgiN
MSMRVVYQLCREIGDDKDLIAHAHAARSAAGCLESQGYRGFEFPENIAIIELWEDEFAYSAHWARLLESEEAFTTVLRSPGTRHLGGDGFEFYPQQYFGNVEGTWTPRGRDKVSAVRWAARLPVRIVGQHTRVITDEFVANLLAYVRETCREPGCFQFEHFRSIENDSDTCTLELWADQIIYDKHWKLRRASQSAGARLASAGEFERPPRLHGNDGYEYYQWVPYKHLYDHWAPEEYTQWSETVLWTI